MKFENIQVMNFENAFRGMRNPMNSWDKSDSKFIYDPIVNNEDNFSSSYFFIGKNDMKLAKKLIKAGSEHRKFMRQIFVSVDITAPLYWWKEFDTYKVGTVANSTSTMHKLATTPITLDCFETDDYQPEFREYSVNARSKNKYNNEEVNEKIELMVDDIIIFLEHLRLKYLETKDERFWKECIRWLPESWLQKRTVTMSYENLYVMVRQRGNHKLSEWTVNFINWVKTLPYVQELIFIDEVEG